MFDRLEDLVIRYQEVMGELQEADVANDPERFRKLMKEQSDLAPIVEAYQEYKNCKQNVEESLMILEEESDEEMRELAKEENEITEMMQRKYPREYSCSRKVADYIEKTADCKLSGEEVLYLTLHIRRVAMADSEDE